MSLGLVVDFALARDFITKKFKGARAFAYCMEHSYWVVDRLRAQITMKHYDILAHSSLCLRHYNLFSADFINTVNMINTVIYYCVCIGFCSLLIFMFL